MEPKKTDNRDIPETQRPNHNWFYFTIPLCFVVPMIYFMFSAPFNDHSGERDSETFSHFGGFIAGVFGTMLALLNAILIYRTFKTQQEQFTIAQNKLTRQIEQQHSQSRLERFESRFFEMIRSNRTIVETMEYEAPDDYVPINGDYTKSENVKDYAHPRGQKVFVKIQLHCQQAMSECKDLIDAAFASKAEAVFAGPDERSFEERIFMSYYKDGYNTLLPLATTVNIAYLCVFYGLGENGRPIAEERLLSVYNKELITKILDRLSCKPVKWSSLWKDYDDQKHQNFSTLDTGSFLKKRFDKYYGGHQHRLGHYFRHLFMLTNFVNEQLFLTYEQKKEYVKMLRSQLSTYEQAVFFMNSLSFPGRIWELQASVKLSNIPIPDRELITKYDLVKNIPEGFIPKIKVPEFYPHVEYELGNVTIRKTELIKNYFDNGIQQLKT